MRNFIFTSYLFCWIGLFSSQAFNTDLLTKADSLELSAEEKDVLDTFGYAPKIKKTGSEFDAPFMNNLYMNFATTKKFKTVNSVLQDDFMYSNEKINIKKIYPNPADEVAYMDYKIIEQLKAKITIRNLIGKVVKEYDLMKGEGQIKIPTLKFDTGLYFYTLSINGKAVGSKKLFVEHR